MERLSNASLEKKQERNYGIDLLRIVSMIMIPILHTLGHGGILENAAYMSVRYDVAWLLETLCMCAVNCYALISGYVGYGRKQKYSNIIYLYFQVFFYGAALLAAFKIFYPSALGSLGALKMLFPIFNANYWYFSAYFCLFFVMPYLNIIVERLQKKSLQRMLIVLFVLFSIIPMFIRVDFGGTNGGYSFIWLALLYIVGAYIKKYGVNLFKKNWKNLMFYGICAVLSWAVKLGVKLLPSSFGIIRSVCVKSFSNITEYISPTIIFCSVFLLLFFANLNVGKIPAKIISFFAPLSFGVYLFHEFPLVRNRLIVGRFTGYLDLNPILMILAVLGTALGIWLVGSLIDELRLLLFKLLRIKKLCAFIEEKASRIVDLIIRSFSAKEERK